jgi:hypothetical protein
LRNELPLLALLPDNEAVLVRKENSEAEEAAFF